MTASASERYALAKKQYEDKCKSVTEHNNKLRVELMQYAMRKSLR
jgi:hypothetical protein